MKIGFLVNHNKKEISPLFIEGGLSPDALEKLWNDGVKYKTNPKDVFLECVFDDEPSDGGEEGFESVVDIKRKYKNFVHYTPNSVHSMLLPPSEKEMFVEELETLIRKYSHTIPQTTSDTLYSIIKSLSPNCKI